MDHILLRSHTLAIPPIRHLISPNGPSAHGASTPPRVGAVYNHLTTAGCNISLVI